MLKVTTPQSFTTLSLNSRIYFFNTQKKLKATYINNFGNKAGQKVLKFKLAIDLYFNASLKVP